MLDELVRRTGSTCQCHLGLRYSLAPHALALRPGHSSTAPALITHTVGLRPVPPFRFMTPTRSVPSVELRTVSENQDPDTWGEPAGAVEGQDPAQGRDNLRHGSLLIQCTGVSSP